MKGINIGKFIGFVHPWILSLIPPVLAFCFGFNYKVDNFEKVLDTSVTFSSIIIGFLAALLGILFTIRDSQIIEVIFESKEKGTLKYYFYESILVGFVVILLSASLYILDSNKLYVEIIFNGWLYLSFTFVTSSFRIVNLLLSAFFKSNDTNNRPPSNMNDINKRAREEIKERLTKPK